MSKPGPKPTVGEEQKAEILECLGMGFSVAEACAAASVTRQSLLRALEADPEFGRDKKRAAEKGRAALLKRISKASEGTWQAAAWMLERIWWKKYAQRRPDLFTAEQLGAYALELVQAANDFIAEDRRAAFAEKVKGIAKRMEASKK